MRGQRCNGFWLKHFGGSHSHSVTIAFDGRFIIAEIAMTGFATALDEDASAAAFGISQVIHNNQVENFRDDMPTVIARDKATSVTFTGSVLYAFGRCRWLVNHW